MVLQSKVFLITLLQKFTPFLSKKKTFIRRVKSVSQQVVKSIHSIKVKKGSDDGLGSSEMDESFESSGKNSPPVEEIEDGCPKSGEMTQTDAMRLFTKIPFPEPRRVIKLRPRVLG